MKAWEARQILEGVDDNEEVMLTIGHRRPLRNEPWPYREHVGTPMYRQYPNWVPFGDRQIVYDTITCH